jgi:hypothetical protein
LLGGLSNFGTDSARGIEMTAGKTHEGTRWRVLGIKVDVTREGQRFANHSCSLNSRP